MWKLYYCLVINDKAYMFNHYMTDEIKSIIDNIKPTDEMTISVYTWKFNTNLSLDKMRVDVLIPRICQAACRKKLKFSFYHTDYEEAEKNVICALMSSAMDSIDLNAKMHLFDLSVIKSFFTHSSRLTSLRIESRRLGFDGIMKQCIEILEGNTGLEHVVFEDIDFLDYRGLTEWFCKYLENNPYLSNIPIIEFITPEEAKPNTKYAEWLENAKKEAEFREMAFDNVSFNSAITQILANKSIRKLTLTNCSFFSDTKEIN